MLKPEELRAYLAEINVMIDELILIVLLGINGDCMRDIQDKI